MKRKMTEGAPEDGVIVHESGFLRAEIEGEQGHALVLLNSPLPTVSLALWRRAAVVVCADGGANWVYDDLPALAVASGDYDGEAAAREALLPRYLIGDLDSVRPEVRAFYAARGTVVIDLSADQDSTDFMKALDLIQGELRPNGGALVPISAPIVALCGSGAERPDHDLGNMSTLFERAHRRIALVGRHCVTRCLPAGRNALRLTEAEGPQCGLIPMAGPARATTKGLQWDLSPSMEMRFGGLISSCNKTVAREVTVESDAPLLWTCCFDDSGIVPHAVKAAYYARRRASGEGNH